MGQFRDIIRGSLKNSSAGERKVRVQLPKDTELAKPTLNAADRINKVNYIWCLSDGKKLLLFGFRTRRPLRIRSFLS